MNDIISVANLGRRFVTKRFLKKKEIFSAVRDVSFNVERGEIVGVVGESGCGKSTLARLLLRLLEPSKGTIIFEGRDFASFSKGEMRQLRRKMQMVFQDPHSSIDLRFTVRNAVLEPYKVQGVSAGDTDKRLAELLNMVGLDGSLADRYPHQLSGGQKQRVACIGTQSFTNRAG